MRISSVLKRTERGSSECLQLPLATGIGGFLAKNSPINGKRYRELYKLLG
jgi:hypothetical protein